VFGTGTARRVSGVEAFGLNFNESFRFLGIDFGADSAFLILVTALFGVFGLGVVWLRRSSFGRRLVAMRDSPAACATLGVNLLATKLVVFALSAAIAGFGGALLGVHLGVVATQDFLMLGGIPYLLLLVVGGVAVVSGALLGGVFLQSFTWLTLIFPGVTVVNWLRRLGPGLSGIGIGRSPEGLIPQVGHEVRERREKKRSAKGKQ
jgi:branched-chain amino acid transport system permease protein